MPRRRERALPFDSMLPWAPAMMAAAAALLVTERAHAVTSDEAMFMRYHEAIYAASKCEDLPPLYQEGPQDPNGPMVQDLHVAMASVIDSRIGDSIGTGEKLSLIDEAKREAHDLIVARGCGSPEVTDLRALFHAELAPALQMPVQ
jgi:hypothetical protein